MPKIQTYEEWLDEYLRKTIARNREAIARSRAEGETPEATAEWEAQVRELEEMLTPRPAPVLLGQLTELRTARDAGRKAAN